MGVLNNIYRRFLGTDKRSVTTSQATALNYSLTSSYVSEHSCRLSAVYRAVEVIASSVAYLPIEVYQRDGSGYLHPLHDSIAQMLGGTPDARMSRYTFVELLIRSKLLRGNAYALIRRYGDKVVGLEYIKAERVCVLYDMPYYDNVRYVVDGIEVAPRDIIHIINVSDNGIEGVSTIKYAYDCLSIATAQDDSAKGFFSGGSNLSGILKVNGAMTDSQMAKVKDSWRQAFSTESGTPNGIAVLPGNMEFQTVSVNPSDAQLLESRLFSIQEIARFFGVNPVKLFDLSKSSYSTVEATQLSFLTDTLAPLLDKIECELERKLYPGRTDIDIRFNTDALLRTDKTTQAGYLQNLVTNGIISPNEARKQLSLPPVEGGDTVKMQVNMTNLSTIDNND